MKAGIFDCDGVLIDSEILYQELERSALAEIGLTYEDQEYVSRFMGRGEAAFHDEVAKDYRIKFAQDVPSDFEPKLRTKVEEHLKSRLKPIEGIDYLLKSLASPKAVASSTRLEFLRYIPGHWPVCLFRPTHLFCSAGGFCKTGTGSFPFHRAKSGNST